MNRIILTFVTAAMFVFSVECPGAHAQAPEAVYYADAYADHYGVSRALVHAIIAQESAWNPLAISKKNAEGLMQLMPATAAMYGVGNRFSVIENLGGGVQYLSELLTAFHGDMRLAVAPTTAVRVAFFKRGWLIAIPMFWPMWKQSVHATAAKYPRKQAAEMLRRQEETDVNQLRLIATVVIAIALGADNLFAQQANIPNDSSQQVDPAILDLPITGSTVSDIHLRPLFTTTIRLPEPVTSVAVGAPTLFKVEHSTDDPRLVFIKPTSADAAVSNLIIALKSGQEISIRLLSNGQASTAPVDFVVNYEPRQSFLIGSTDALDRNAPAPSDPPAQAKPIDVALREQEDVASPQWVNGMEKQARNASDTVSTEPILVALGAIENRGERMLVAYSVVNTSGHWVEVLPPQVELRSPDHDAGKKKKQKQTLADQVPVAEFRLSARRLAPGQRADGAVEFSRPGFKQSADRLVLEIATASAVDHPLLLQLPFVAPGE